MERLAHHHHPDIKGRPRHTVVEVEEEAGHIFIIDFPSPISLILRDELEE